MSNTSYKRPRILLSRVQVNFSQESTANNSTTPTMPSTSINALRDIENIVNGPLARINRTISTSNNVHRNIDNTTATTPSRYAQIGYPLNISDSDTNESDSAKEPKRNKKGLDKENGGRSTLNEDDQIDRRNFVYFLNQQKLTK